MIDAWLDLLLGSCCTVCGAPGRALCHPCTTALPTRAEQAWPTPTPPGLVPPWTTGEYAGAVRTLVLDHKEHGRLALARPLGRLLAVAASAAWDSEQAGRHRSAAATGAPGILRLVPVPSHPAVVRGRGQDPLLRLTQHAAAELRRWGTAATVCPALRVVARPGDQAGLDARQRAANVAGRFRVKDHVGRDGGPILLVDDVITTGATLREAQRALEEDDLPPFAAATVAATRRRSPGAQSGDAPRLPIRPGGG